jgi:hypothetical protein
MAGSTEKADFEQLLPPNDTNRDFSGRADLFSAKPWLDRESIFTLFYLSLRSSVWVPNPFTL